MNTATATGRATVGTLSIPVTATDVAHLFGTAPGISVVKLANGHDANTPADAVVVEAGKHRDVDVPRHRDDADAAHGTSRWSTTTAPPRTRPTTACPCTSPATRTTTACSIRARRGSTPSPGSRPPGTSRTSRRRAARPARRPCYDDDPAWIFGVVARHPGRQGRERRRPVASDAGRGRQRPERSRRGRRLDRRVHLPRQQPGQHRPLPGRDRRRQRHARERWPTTSCRRYVSGDVAEHRRARSGRDVAVRGQRRRGRRRRVRAERRRPPPRRCRRCAAVPVPSGTGANQPGPYDPNGTGLPSGQRQRRRQRQRPARRRARSATRTRRTRPAR